MTDTLDTRLAELLCARLCHDLANPLGAAAAGLELLEDGGDAETMGLISASMTACTARLKFLRAALGPATDLPHKATALGDVMRAYLGGALAGGIGLDWSSDRTEIDGETARLLLNLVLIARDALPRGGRISAHCGPDAPQGGALRVLAGGDGVGLSAEARLVLMDNAPPSGPRGAQAWFARHLAGAKGLKIGLELRPGEISIMA
jgi:histidine phosphotransferase ChpT